MKKIISLIFLLALFSAYTAAQADARTVYQKTLRDGQWFYEYTGVAADTVGTAQDSLIYEILTNKARPVNAAVRLEVTRTGSTDDYEYRLQGKVFENDTWTSLVDSTAQTVSRSLYHPDVEVDVTQAASVTPFYRYFRLVVASDGTVAATDKLKVNKVIWKFWER